MTVSKHRRRDSPLAKELPFLHLNLSREGRLRFFKQVYLSSSLTMSFSYRAFRVINILYTNFPPPRKSYAQASYSPIVHLKRELCSGAWKNPLNIPQVFVGVIPTWPGPWAGGSILSQLLLGQGSISEAVETSRLLKITLCNKAKANNMHFPGLFAECKSYSKPILLSPWCSWPHLWKWRSCKLGERCKGTGFLQSVTQKGRNKCCLLFEVVLSTPAEPWQEISSIHK